MQILSLNEIKPVLAEIDLIPEIEAAFSAYSRDEAVVPPVGELIFDNPPGDVHIKYGYLRNDDYYVIKIASGFYENSKLGLPSNSGLMLLYKKQTGELEAILCDEGYLTDVRTAVAGAVAAKHLAPKNVERIGIVGTGVQALLQLEHLRAIRECRTVLVWGRDAQKCHDYASKAQQLGFEVEIAQHANDVLTDCSLIVTTTASTEPVLTGQAKPGTHITAVGSDTHLKQELASSILQAADVVVADSIEQCLLRGEIHKAIKNGVLQQSELLELGVVVADSTHGRKSESDVTIADLTGVAVQDISIAKAVYLALAQDSPAA